jgi:hypothetical protein
LSEVTRILNAVEQGDRAAAHQLLPLVYDELRKLAAARMADEAPDHTLEALGFRGKNARRPAKKNGAVDASRAFIARYL